MFDVTDDEALTREVYARFGLAYYMTECVHRGLVQVVALLGIDRLGVTRPRIEERMKVAGSMTFGELAPQAKALVPAALHGSLDWALAKRNFLAHGFWYERIHMMSSADGQEQLVDELTDTTERLQELSRILDDITFEHLRAHGFTQEMFEAAFAHAKLNPVEPFPQRRVPKTEERIEIMKAWSVRADDGGAVLVLEDATGDRWQLCDVGLGWCYLDEADGGWTPFAKLGLPAHVVARPKNAKSWDYKLHVSSGSLIAVRRMDSGRIEWRIEPLP